MKTRNIILLTAALTMGFVSCKKKGCTDPTAINYSESAEKDDGSCEWATDATVTLNFTQNVNGTDITVSDFNQLNYVTPEGNTYSITKMQYMISDVRFYKGNGDSVMIEGYHLIDMEDAASLSYALPEKVDLATYTGIGFNYGFEPADNISGQYADLNAASWSSPEMLGGGYHQMKFEGRYIDDNTDTVNFQYHNLSEIRKIDTDTTFHNNYVHIDLDQSLDISKNTTIEIQMDVQEWFENPNLWDLDTYFSMLMPNYDAQVMMSENASTVFAVGTVE